MPLPLCDHCRSSHCICDVKVCNCARCKKELTADRDVIQTLRQQRLRGDQHVRQLDLLIGRHDGRPYCHRCFPIPRHPAQVAMHFHSCRTPRQQAKMGNSSC